MYSFIHVTTATKTITAQAISPEELDELIEDTQAEMADEQELDFN